MVATSLLAAVGVAAGTVAVYGPGTVIKNLLGALVGAIKMPTVYALRGLALLTPPAADCPCDCLVGQRLASALTPGRRLQGDPGHPQGPLTGVLHARLAAGRIANRGWLHRRLRRLR